MSDENKIDKLLMRKETSNDLRQSIIMLKTDLIVIESIQKCVLVRFMVRYGAVW